MRYLIAVVIPFVIQLLAYVGVFAASRGGGSFMGLLAMPVAAVAIPALLVTSIAGARGERPLGGLALKSLVIALVPPLLLLIFRALES